MPELRGSRSLRRLLETRSQLPGLRAPVPPGARLLGGGGDLQYDPGHRRLLAHIRSVPPGDVAGGPLDLVGTDRYRRHRRHTGVVLSVGADALDGIRLVCSPSRGQGRGSGPPASRARGFLKDWLRVAWLSRRASLRLRPHQSNGFVRRGRGVRRPSLECNPFRHGTGRMSTGLRWPVLRCRPLPSRPP